MNTSATGGYLVPSVADILPGTLTLTQFIQTVLVGISGLPTMLVRPKWQMNPPKQPDLNVNWLTNKITQNNPDTYGFFSLDPEGNGYSQRHEDLSVQCSFYGPSSYDYAGIVIDGFQIPQNLETLRTANMGFTSSGQILTMPDLVNERWVEKYELEIILRREIQRDYAILSFLSASGTINTDTTPPKTVTWEVT